MQVSFYVKFRTEIQWWEFSLDYHSGA